MRNYALSWIALHPDGAPESLVCVGGDCQAVTDLDLTGILRIIDRTQALLDASPGPA